MNGTSLALNMITLLLLAGGLVFTSTVFAAAADQQTGTVKDSGSVIGDSSATLTRTDHGISVVIQTSELQPGHHYTLWWDLRNYDGSDNTDTRAVIIATNATADSNGNATFGANIQSGLIPADNDVTVRVNVTQGGDSIFDNPRGVIVRNIIRDHGPTQPGKVDNQKTTHGGGCNNDPLGDPENSTNPGNFMCGNPQEAVDYN